MTHHCQAIRYSAALGRMHAASIGKQEHYQRLRGGPGIDPHASFWHCQNLLEAIDRLDIPPVANLRQELAQLDRIIHHPRRVPDKSHLDKALI